MSVYLRQIICMDTSIDDAYLNGVTFDCARCNTKVDVEKIWISDDGLLCKECCAKLYPQRFVNSNHKHEWKTYDSGWDKYDYCECGEKRRT